MRKFAIGDIHGGLKALDQCLERSKFNINEDKLISIGDVVDGWSESIESIRRLSEVKNLVYVLGNHDLMFIDYLVTGEDKPIWTMQGGRATLESLKRNGGDHIKEEILRFFERGNYYHEEDNKLFVHGGYYHKEPIEDQEIETITWDRTLWQNAQMWEYTGAKIKYDEVFIGHTSTPYTHGNKGNFEPQKKYKIWNLDQGAGWEGVLTIMDIDTKEYWQSDKVSDLYQNEKGG